jgi:hypothetical protein
MIGLISLAIVFCYIFLSKFIVAKVYEKTKSIKKKNIAIAIMILIPTWDVILGFPIYAYLCAFESGTRIYKTVDNVEGFYIGGFEEDDDRYNPIEPYKGYRYIEYQITNNKNPTRKFFRNYWLDNNTSKLCINPNLRYPNSSYSHQFRSEKCIAQEEINKAKLSRWELAWANEESKVTILGIFFIKGNVIKDSKTNSTLAEDYRVQWSGGWVNSLISGIHNASLKFTSRSVSCNFRNSGTNIVNQTLKTKKE